MINSHKLKICLTASSGGHITQLLKLGESWARYETFSITTTEVVREKLQKFSSVYTVGECNRQHPILVFNVLLQCIRIILKERPDVIISTGAAVGCIACFLGKFIGAKIIWLDSITNVEKLSLSGRMVRLIADLFLVQWPHLAQRYHGVKYVGALV